MIINVEEKYQKEAVPALMKKWHLKNKMAVPRVKYVVVNMGIAADRGNKEAVEEAKKVLAQITGQWPQLRPARKSIAGFSLRAGQPVGLKVTLRRKRAADFLTKLFNIVLPRVKDFRGLSRRGFDGHGNYTIGFKENTVFPEVDYDKIDRPRGLEVTIVTSADDDEKGEALLSLLGAPFKKEEDKK